MARTRIRRKEKNGTGLLFILVTLVVVAVAGARFFGFYPNGPQGQKAPPPAPMGDEVKSPPIVDPTPKIMVLHSHATENYAGKDSHERGGNSGDVVKVGDVLVQRFEELGITAIHDKTIHDIPRYSEAFLNSAKAVEGALAKNPAIQMILDIHRDGLQDKPDGYTTAKVNGKDVAKILFVVGDKDNTKVDANLAFAEQISKALDAKYPGVSRGVRVFKSNYSGQLHPNSVMVLIGDWKGNTVEQANESARLLGEVIATLVK